MRGRRPTPRTLVAPALSAAILAAALATGVFGHELRSSVAGWGSFGWPALAAGRWWTLATSLVLSRNLFMAVTMVPAVLLALGAYERRAGWGRALAVAGIGHVTASVAVALGAGLLGATGQPVLVRAAQNLDYGASMVVAAALGALASRTGDRRFRRACFIGVVVLVPLHHNIADWSHLVALPTGFVVDRARRPAARRAGLVLVGAATVWLTALGAPLVSNATEAVRFDVIASHTDTSNATASPAALAATETSERDEGRIVDIVYTAHHLGDRPSVARAYVPAHAHGRLPVALFFHGVPGAPDDWIAGGRLDRALDHAIATHELEPMLAVLVDDPAFHDARAGWHDVHGQATTSSIRRDLLPALARRFPVALGARSVAVVGAGRGVTGAVELARADDRVGWLVALSPPNDVPNISGVRVIGTGQHRDRAGRAVRHHLDAARRWRHWAGMIPHELDALAHTGFGRRAT